MRQGTEDKEHPLPAHHLHRNMCEAFTKLVMLAFYALSFYTCKACTHAWNMECYNTAYPLLCNVYSRFLGYFNSN